MIQKAGFNNKFNYFRYEREIGQLAGIVHSPEVIEMFTMSVIAETSTDYPHPRCTGGGANVRSHMVLYIMACVDDPNLTVATSSPRTGVTLTYCVPRN